MLGWYPRLSLRCSLGGPACTSDRMLCFVMVLAFGLLLIGVNYGLRNDVNAFAQQSAEAGANALTGVLDDVPASRARDDPARSQGSGLAAQTSRLRAHDVRAASPSKCRREANLSFVIIVDAHGNVVAGTRPATGSLKAETRCRAREPVIPTVDRSSYGGQLRTLGISAPGGRSRSRAPRRLRTTPVTSSARSMAACCWTPRSRASTTWAALRAVPRASPSTARSSRPRLPVPGDAAPDRYRGAARRGLRRSRDVLGSRERCGRELLREDHADRSIDGNVIGDYWFGVPFAQFEAIVTNTLRQIVLWGVMGLAIAVVAGSFLPRASASDQPRSEEVNESAKELACWWSAGKSRETTWSVPGRPSRRSGRSLRSCRRARRPGFLQVLAQPGGRRCGRHRHPHLGAFQRMRDAAARVERLSAVAQELEQLVAGVVRAETRNSAQADALKPMDVFSRTSFKSTLGGVFGLALVRVARKLS